MTSPDRLLSAIRAALDDLERALIRYRGGHEGPCVNFEGQDPADYDVYDSCARHIAVAEATPYRDVEFGLRDIESKRRMLDLHHSEPASGFDADGWEHHGYGCAVCYFADSYPCPTIRALARGLGIDPEETP